MCRQLCALFVATLLVMLSPAWASAQEAEVDAFMQRQMAARHIPGASIAVVKDGRVVLQRGYGVANVEHQVPATEHTMYQLASVTKSFTATAVLLLVEEGKLTLQASRGTVMPDVPAAWAPVTISRLLTHTSGIPSYTSPPAEAG